MGLDEGARAVLPENPHRLHQMLECRDAERVKPSPGDCWFGEVAPRIPSRRPWLRTSTRGKACGHVAAPGGFLEDGTPILTKPSAQCGSISSGFTIGQSATRLGSACPVHRSSFVVRIFLLASCPRPLSVFCCSRAAIQTFFVRAALFSHPSSPVALRRRAATARGSDPALERGGRKMVSRGRASVPPAPHYLWRSVILRSAAGPACFRLQLAAPQRAMTCAAPGVRIGVRWD